MPVSFPVRLSRFLSFIYWVCSIISQGPDLYRLVPKVVNVGGGVWPSELDPYLAMRQAAIPLTQLGHDKTLIACNSMLIHLILIYIELIREISSELIYSRNRTTYILFGKAWKFTMTSNIYRVSGRWKINHIISEKVMTNLSLIRNRNFHDLVMNNRMNF